MSDSKKAYDAWMENTYDFRDVGKDPYLYVWEAAVDWQCKEHVEQLRLAVDKLKDVIGQRERYRTALELIASAKPHHKSEAQIAREALQDE